MPKSVLIVAIALLFCGCEKVPDQSAELELYAKSVSQVAGAPARFSPSDQSIVMDEPGKSPSIPAILPQIAYNYEFSYTLEGDDVAKAQVAHVSLCDKLGGARCRVVSQQRASASTAWGKLSLQVDSEIAKQFGDDVDASIAGLGGRSAMRQINAEDVSKQMIDASARVRAKQALADRLLILIQRRDGKVADLVEAERAFAEAQEELESARQWMADLRGRVAMSRFDITYNPNDQDSAVAPRQSSLRKAIGNAGYTLADSLASLIYLVVAALPWILTMWALVRLGRWRGWFRNWRWPWRRTEKGKGAETV